MRVAALDDDVDHLDLVRRTVEAAGHACLCFERGGELLRALRRESFDLLVVDWQLPDLDGIEVVRRVREQGQAQLPILFLTSRGDERDVVEGLGAGADDYMVKPIRVLELTARLRALLRRSHPAEAAEVLECGGYRLELRQRRISFEGVPIELTQREFDLARCLFAQPGRLLSRGHLFSAVWGLQADIPSRTLDTHISTLRSKLHLRPERGFRLGAVYGQGYRLEAVGAPPPGEPQAAAGEAGEAAQ